MQPRCCSDAKIEVEVKGQCRDCRSKVADGVSGKVRGEKLLARFLSRMRQVFNRPDEVGRALFVRHGAKLHTSFAVDVGQGGRSKGGTRPHSAITASNVKPFITGHPFCMPNDHADFDPFPRRDAWWEKARSLWKKVPRKEAFQDYQQS